MVGPDAESTSTGGFAVEVMTGVLDDKAKVEIACEVDSELNLSYIGGIDSVRRITTKSTGAGDVVASGQACATLEKRPHDRCRIFHAAKNNISIRFVVGFFRFAVIFKYITINDGQTRGKNLLEVRVSPFRVDVSTFSCVLVTPARIA